MTYQEIKINLAMAARLVDAGEVAQANKKIREMLGKGLCRADLDANLSRAQLKALREYSAERMMGA